jgi:hypothetical protein
MVSGLYAQMPHAKFNSYLRIMISKTMMDSLVKPYKVFIKMELRLAFWNGIELDGLVDKNVSETL